MSSRRISDLNLREILHRLRAKESDRRIARELEISRNTVKKYREWAEAQGFLTSSDLPDVKTVEARRDAVSPFKACGPESTVEPYRSFVEEKRADGVELVALHALLRERGFDGSYSALRRFVAQIEKQEPEKFVRVETPPGEEAQVDFGYVGMIYDELSKRERKAWVFVMTLSFSRHQYAEIVFDQRVETWIRLHITAFESFGGVVNRVVIDNLKSGIVKAVVHDPEPQRSYRDFAEHYGFLISPCRPRTPQHKGKVESGVHYVKRNALAGRKFTHLAAANAHRVKWVDEIAGRRCHGTTCESPFARFDREKTALLGLPRERYEIATWTTAKVRSDCHVSLDYSHYSVPHRLVGKEVSIKVTADRVEIYHRYERVTSHARAKSRGEWVTQLEHYPPEKVAGLLPEPVRIREDALRVGPQTGEFIGRMLGDKAMDRLRGAQSVLRLEKRFGGRRLEAACARALAFDEIRCHTVKNILARNLDFESAGVDVIEFPGPLPKTSRFARSATELTTKN